MEKIYSKVGNCFYVRVPKLANFRNQNREKPEIINNTPYKRSAAGPRKEN